MGINYSYWSSLRRGQSGRKFALPTLATIDAVRAGLTKAQHSGTTWTLGTLGPCKLNAHVIIDLVLDVLGVLVLY